MAGEHGEMPSCHCQGYGGLTMTLLKLAAVAIAVFIALYAFVVHHERKNGR